MNDVSRISSRNCAKDDFASETHQKQSREINRQKACQVWDTHTANHIFHRTLEQMLKS